MQKNTIENNSISIELNNKLYFRDSSISKNHAEAHPKLTIVLTKLSSALEAHGVKAESVWTASYKKAIDNLPKATDQSISSLITQNIVESEEIKPIRNKRKLSDNSLTIKKVKWDWDIECTNLLNEFKQIRIENYKLSDSFRKDELIRYKASLASKSAINIMKKLSSTDKDLSDTKKLCRLKEAQNAFSNSIKFYSQTGLLKQKAKTIYCDNILTLTIKKLNPLFNKTFIKNSTLSGNKKSENHTVSHEQFNQPIRYTRAFFRALSCPENDVKQIGNQYLLSH